MKRIFARVAGSVVLMLSLIAAAGAPPPPSVRAEEAGAPAGPAGWRTWHLESADQFRLGAPPKNKSKKTRRELKELLRFQRARTPAVRARIKKWNRGAVVLPWTDLTLRMIVKHRPRPPFAGRTLAYVHTGLHDALVAAHDSKNAYKRTPPHRLERRLKPRIKMKRSTYPPPVAVMAGTAETLLTYLFPNENPKRFKRLATQAVRSRLFAGANYRSDVRRGRRLGRRVAKLSIAKAEQDGHKNTGVSNPRPEGDGYWEPAPPGFEPNIGGPVGTWSPWLMDSPDQARVDSQLPAPSSPGSQELLAETMEVLDVAAGLTAGQQHIAVFWDDGPNTFTPGGHWFDIARDLIKSTNTGTNRAALILGVLGASQADAPIAFYEAKYHWWSVRPITIIRRLCDDPVRVCSSEELEADPSLAIHPDWFSYIITPPFPSYPGGHSTFSGSAGKVLAHFFPGEADLVNAMADEAAMSRLYGGIHFREDNDAGLQLGRQLADYAIQWAESVNSP